MSKWIACPIKTLAPASTLEKAYSMRTTQISDLVCASSQMEYMLWAADGWLPSVKQIAVYFVKNDSRMKLLQNPEGLRQGNAHCNKQNSTA